MSKPNRRELYKYVKANNIKNVKWTMKAADMAKIVDKHKLNLMKNKTMKANQIKQTFRKFTIRKAELDKRALESVNTGTNKTEMTLSRFGRIRKDIISPADRKLIIHFKDENGNVLKTSKINDKIISVDDLFMTEENEYESGANFDVTVLPTSLVELEWIINPARSRSERKNFFRYITMADYNMEAFQVYSNDYYACKENDINDADIPCFLFALTEAGVDKHIVNQISQTMFHYGATIDFIRKTAKAFNLYISVKQYQFIKEKNWAGSKITNYGDKSDNVIKLGSVGEHLFAIKPTKVTKAALDRPNLVKMLGRTDFIIINNKPYFNHNRIKLLDSYEVISYLYHNRNSLLEPITQRNMPDLLNGKYQEVRTLHESDFNKNNFREIGRTKKCSRKTGCSPFLKLVDEKLVEAEKFNVVYFDFETFVKNGKHEAYCISYTMFEYNTTTNSRSEMIETRHFRGPKCATDFLKSLPPNSQNLLYAHNAGFDFRFLVRQLKFSAKKVNIIDSGTKLKFSTGFYKGREIVIKDTMSFIAGSLSRMPSMFKKETKHLSLEKECFPHHLVNQNNYDSLWPLSSLDSYKDKDILIKNATAIGAIHDDMFDCKAYSEHYCTRDVDVVRICFERFRELMNEFFELDVYRFISISSMSYAYLFNEGCYDDCYAQNSVILSFLREAIVGGRCMTRDNIKHHVMNMIADYDANSLYPSAMLRLKGFVKGMAKLFKGSIPEDADFYVARIRVDSVGKHRHFPLQCYSENGTKNYTNDMEGRYVILGKEALEDFVNFQDVKYTVIEGVYWNEGFNDQICKSIRKMYDERVKYKKDGNSLHEVIKLMMNSSYGKLLQKPIVKQKVFVSGDKETIQAYTQKNIHKMISRTPISDDLAIFEEHKALREHFSPAHLGIQILDSSKHIMNKVMCLAEDIDVKIYYQDTDSMHVDFDSVPKLIDSYREKYGTELDGKDMGQFHIDFDLKGAEGETYAKECIFLGKKSYLDVLECTGNDVKGNHIRMKGIPGKLLEEDTYNKYMRLYNGEELSFDLSELCSISINTKNQQVTRREKFIRKVSF